MVVADLTLRQPGCAGPISKIISTQGMKAVYNALDAQGKKEFEEAYAASYGPAMDVSPSCQDAELGQAMSVAHAARASIDSMLTLLRAAASLYAWCEEPLATHA